MFKVNSRNTRTRCETFSKLTIKAPEGRLWRRSGVFIVNFETYFTPCSIVSAGKFEHVNADWDGAKKKFCYPAILKQLLKQTLQGMFLAILMTETASENYSNYSKK